MFKIISLLFTITTPITCFAISVGEITSIIQSDQTILSKEITNTTDVARYIGLKVSRISTPLEGGVVIPTESSAEIMSAPASIVLPGEAKEFFRVVYQGPQDDQERYYRLSWLDAPISQFEAAETAKNAQVTTSAQIDTILVVAPRKEIFGHTRQADEITNTGNVTFRVVAVGACKNKELEKEAEGCRERYFVMPGKSLKLKHTDVTQAHTHIGIWHNGQYISIK